MRVRLTCCSALSCILVLISAAPLHAQEPLDTVKLTDFVITADRVAEPIGKVISATTVITGAELRERGIHFVADALRGVPGAAVVSTGSFGGVTSLFVRGGESDYVKVLVDGVPVNQDGGFYDFGSLTTDNIERIEIVRGPTSVLYGSDAMTGVVQIITRGGADNAQGEAAVRAGTFGTWRAEAAASAGSPVASFSAGLSRYNSDGIQPFNSDYRSTAASASVQLAPDDRTRVSLGLRTGDHELHLPTDFSGAVVDSNALNLRRTFTAGLVVTRTLGQDLSLSVLLSSHADNEDADNRPDSPGDTTGFFQSISQGSFHRQSAEVRLLANQQKRVRLTMGAIAEFEDLRESSQSQFNFGSGASLSTAEFAASRHNIAGYGQAIADLGDKTLLNAGARLDQNEEFGTHLTVRIGAVHQLFGSTRVRGSFGTGFKEPSLRENFAVTAFERGNPDLEPEQSRGWELGLEQSLAGGRAVVTATWFDQRFKDLIQYRSPAAPTDTTYFNVARATSRGVEVSLDLQPVPSFITGVSYTWLDTRLDDAGFDTQPGDVFLKDDRLLRRPTHSLRIDGRYHFARRVSLGAALTYVGDRDDVDFRPFPSVRTELPSYSILDLDASVAFPLGQGIEVTPTVRVENALDENYETVVGFPGRKRTVLAGARVTF